MTDDRANGRSRQRRICYSFFGALVLGISCFIYFIRSDHAVLFFYGAAPVEVPHGKAIAILNPLRNRKDEGNAERLIRDLRTDKCEGIASEMLVTDPARICRVMRGNATASLIWLDPESDTMKGGTRKLVYDLPDKKARIVVDFGPDEPGWGVKSFSIIQ